MLGPLFAAMAAAAQTYPAKAVKAIVPFGPGGQSDQVTRIIAQKLSERWNQSVVVENRPGANGNIGTDAAVKSAPDGYTLYFPAQTVAVNAVLAPNAAWDPRKDLVPISITGFSENVLVVNPAVPVNSIPEFIAYAKANPGKLYYGATSVGSSGQVGMEALKNLTGMQVEMVLYTNITNLVLDLIAGRITAYLTPLTAVGQHIQAGKLRALGVTGTKRQALFPEVPTFKESGLTTFEASTWYGVFAPLGTPRNILDKVNADVRWALEQEDVKQRLAAGGVAAPGSTPEQLRGLMQREIEQVETLVRKGALKPL